MTVKADKLATEQPGKVREIDICEDCGEEFGSSGEDGNGYNCTCVHCGNNTYYTRAEEPM